VNECVRVCVGQYCCLTPDADPQESNTYLHIRHDVIHLGTYLQKVSVVLDRQLSHVADEVAVEQRADHNDHNEIESLRGVLRSDVAVSYRPDVTECTAGQSVRGSRATTIN